MVRIFTKWCAAIALALSFQRSAWAGTAFEQIHALVALSLQAQAQTELDRESLRIGEITKWELSDGAAGAGADEQVRIKYLLSDWRQQTRLFLVHQSANGPAAFAAAVESLLELGALIDAPTVHRLMVNAAALHESSSQIMPRLLTLLATHGEASAVIDHLRHDEKWVRLAALDAMTNHQPSRPSYGWGVDGWIHNRRFARYQVDGWATVYRGQHFEPGDILLVDPTPPSSGLEFSFTSERNGMAHCGLLFYLDEAGHRIPAVLEVHSMGLRVVPLATFVSPHFVHYAEVYRPRSRAGMDAPDWDRRVNGIARRLLREQLGLDFNARPIPDRGYAGMRKIAQRSVFSVSLIDAFFKSMSIDLQLKETELESGARSTLAGLQMDRLAERGRLLTPSSLKNSPGLQRVATIDNGFSANARRELLVGSADSAHSAGDHLAHRELAAQQWSLLGGRAHHLAVRYYADQVERETLLGRGILKLVHSLYGVPSHALPQATPQALAVLSVLHNQLDRADRKLRCPHRLAGVASPTPFDLQQFQADPQTQERVRQALESSGFTRGFR